MTFEYMLKERERIGIEQGRSEGLAEGEAIGLEKGAAQKQRVKYTLQSGHNKKKGSLKMDIRRRDKNLDYGQ